MEFCELFSIPQERSLHADAIDHAPNHTLVLMHVVAEHADLAAVEDQQRRDQADQRGLTGAVCSQQPKDLAARHGDRDLVDRDGQLARLACAALPEWRLRATLLAEAFERAD